MEITLLLAFLFGVGLLLVLILLLKINAFISLLISSISVGLMAGMNLSTIINTVKDGMGGTLGYIAIVIGLGAIFGEILRESGATERLSTALLKAFGIKRSPLALSITGFIIAIPVFFDVAFIILMPLLYSLQKKTKKSLLFSD
jgi:Gnt-I system low-affinity gluconate transporter